MNSIGDVKFDKKWSFSNLKRSDTNYVTHGYHSYPAKFIPQLASSLITRYSKAGDVVCDPFGGCGTTMVESKILGRSFFGLDINPVAVLISKAKIYQINPQKLTNHITSFNESLESFSARKINISTLNPRIQYWFKSRESKKLKFLLSQISVIKDSKIRRFFYCAFSSILKSSSLWLQKSNKPTKDFKKIPQDSFILFNKQLRKMNKLNRSFFEVTNGLDYKNKFYRMRCADARKTPIGDKTVNLIVTSPPYATSYEYADLHQLSMLWFQYIENTSDIREKFIGTAFKMRTEHNLSLSVEADKILNKLVKIDRRTTEMVNTYFNDMNKSFIEMYRVLKKNSFACIVIGDTKFKGVNIYNSKVFLEQLELIGFKVKKVIKRKVCSKNIPSTRDKLTGRFTSKTSSQKTEQYNHEYIIIAQKL